MNQDPPASGADPAATDASAPDEIGADEIGTDEIGADEIGTDEIGADEIGTDEIGADATDLAVGVDSTGGQGPDGAATGHGGDEENAADTTTTIPPARTGRLAAAGAPTGAAAGPPPGPTGTATATATATATKVSALARLNPKLADQLARLGGIEIEVAGVLGETRIAIHDLLAWLPGTIVPLQRPVGVPADLRIDDTTVAHGEVVVIDEHYGLRVLDIVLGSSGRSAANLGS